MTERDYFKAKLLLEKEKTENKKGIKYVCPDCGFKCYDKEKVCPNCLKLFDKEIEICYY